jgi:hypothetical protein
MLEPISGNKRGPDNEQYPLYVAYINDDINEFEKLLDNGKKYTTGILLEKAIQEVDTEKKFYLIYKLLEKDAIDLDLTTSNYIKIKKVLDDAYNIILFDVTYQHYRDPKFLKIVENLQRKLLKNLIQQDRIPITDPVTNTNSVFIPEGSVHPFDETIPKHRGVIDFNPPENNPYFQAYAHDIVMLPHLPNGEQYGEDIQEGIYFGGKSRKSKSHIRRKSKKNRKTRRRRRHGRS